MPVFSKGLLCGGGSRADGKRRTGCLAASDDDDDSLEAICAGIATSADADNPQLRSLNNTDLDVQPGSRNTREEDEGEDGFRFFLTLADLQFPDPDNFALVEIEGEGRLMSETGTVSPAALEFEQADMTPVEPVKKPPLKCSAKSSCGRASSPEEDESVEEEPEVPPIPEPSKEDFLVLLTGLLAHSPPPPDEFRFFLTVHQAEAAT